MVYDPNVERSDELRELEPRATRPNATTLLEQCRALDARLPPAPWVADIDDPNTDPTFTGKFEHPPIPHTALCLYDDPAAAADLATLRNLFHQLVAEKNSTSEK